MPGPEADGRLPLCPSLLGALRWLSGGVVLFPAAGPSPSTFPATFSKILSFTAPKTPETTGISTAPARVTAAAALGRPSASQATPLTRPFIAVSEASTTGANAVSEAVLKRVVLAS